MGDHPDFAEKNPVPDGGYGKALGLLEHPACRRRFRQELDQLVHAVMR